MLLPDTIRPHLQDPFAAIMQRINQCLGTINIDSLSERRQTHIVPMTRPLGDTTPCGILLPLVEESFASQLLCVTTVCFGITLHGSNASKITYLRSF